MKDVILNCKKTQFCDEETAQFYIDKLKKTSKRKRKPVDAYLCTKCFAWHLTSIVTDQDTKNSQTDKQILVLKQKINDLKKENRILEGDLKRIRSQLSNQITVK